MQTFACVPVNALNLREKNYIGIGIPIILEVSFRTESFIKYNNHIVSGISKNFMYNDLD